MSRPASWGPPIQVPAPVTHSGFGGSAYTSHLIFNQASVSPVQPFPLLPTVLRAKKRASTMFNNVLRPGTTPSSARTDSMEGMARSETHEILGGRHVSFCNDLHTTHPEASIVSSSSNTPHPTLPVKTYRIRLVTYRDSTPSLGFEPILRAMIPRNRPRGANPVSTSKASIGELKTRKTAAAMLSVGRFTERVASEVDGDQLSGDDLGTKSRDRLDDMNMANGGGRIGSEKVIFRSMVISRAHAEIWCETGGQFYIRDTASRYGTFLNHIRLSDPGFLSKPLRLNDGDILQLGVSHQGSRNETLRCVKMRIEVGRDWQTGVYTFNSSTSEQIKSLREQSGSSDSSMPMSKHKASGDDCCICLVPISVCQSLFVAPCSHVFHYKCLRPLLSQHFSDFSCPLCVRFQLGFS